MAKRLLITGGTGFIGSSLAIQAIKNGYSVTSLSRSVPEEKIEDVTYIYADVSDNTQLLEKLSVHQFEYVVNLSGDINHSPADKGGNYIYDVHARGVHNLIDTLDCGVLKKFIQIGSSDEYGNQPAPQHEELEASPFSPYSEGKASATQYLQKRYETENFPVIVLRLFLVYGPAQSPKRFLPQIIKGCLENKQFPASEGRQLRDFCYVEDIVNGILISLETAEEVDGEVINLASGDPISIREMIEKVQRTVGSGMPSYGEIPFREGENQALVADISKAIELLNWKPEISIDDGVLRTVEAYKNSLCHGQ
jgi:nucleoside-diphosphate-sugar epimerase